MNLTYTVDVKAARAELAGPLGREAIEPLAALAKRLAGAKRATLDLSGLSAINSRGAAAWHGFLKQLAAHAEITLERCPSYFIDYVNLAPAVGDQATIASFYLPLACGACAHAEMRLLRTDDVAAPADVEAFPCPACGAVLVPEVDPELYLEFLGLTR